MEYLQFDFLNILSVFLVLFAVIDITGSMPIILDLKAKTGKIEAGKAALISLVIFIAFLFAGDGILGIFGVDISSFAIAGSFILLILALEMILVVEIFKNDTMSGSSVVPIAFPLIAGAGSLTTLLSLRSQYSVQDIIVGIVLNVIVVYYVLKSTSFIERILGKAGILILQKVFGIILLSVAIKLFLENTGVDLQALKHP